MTAVTSDGEAETDRENPDGTESGQADDENDPRDTGDPGTDTETSDRMQTTGNEDEPGQTDQDTADTPDSGTGTSEKRQRWHLCRRRRRYTGHYKQENVRGCNPCGRDLQDEWNHRRKSDLCRSEIAITIKSCYTQQENENQK